MQLKFAFIAPVIVSLVASDATIDELITSRNASITHSASLQKNTIRSISVRTSYYSVLGGYIDCESSKEVLKYWNRYKNVQPATPGNNDNGFRSFEHLKLVHVVEFL
ncbi:hypothetical protein HBI56_092110 [Parastagonospora nodorum]|uniref:Uncharacterized protein n=1 Tax=Phaeosphaeria nodorum (strain SN15 / ATCC MYA-4574 / FGSC 10173) TaxID=321614 RepID=A0A7U2HZS9_PHANO|nr:hypothetical protein HBH56_087510 [Parastagonospora nodorum]QRC97980.1 hypothetical protein JI435_435340 [Parastagonospora nodorum SN15]KAH3936259.1 hypothetical protein HBH54_022150 [Parastagonospora nodorum]KAH3945714.1 hypothetical protein HBH53_139260 [Parastagonospora nodorum]KAH3966289.1 hypothetical protein HBH51_146090 [Parastagonospora nodorum]